MFAEFETFIRKQANLTDRDMELIRSRVIEKTLRKKERLLNEGEVCRYKAFVCKGLLRTYSTKEDGSEHIIMFSPECWWSTDPESYDNLTPSRYTIDALEDSELILWTKQGFDDLLEQIPQLRAFSERVKSINISLSRRRILSALSSTAEEKYDEFVSTFPEIFARVPLHMVASYLGMSRKTLTRIRHDQVKF